MLSLKRALRFLGVSDLPAHFRFFPPFHFERIHPLTVPITFFKLIGESNRVKKQICKTEIAHFKLKIGELFFLRVSVKMEIISSELAYILLTPRKKTTLSCEH